jgi:hypothetical protein
MPTGLNGSPVLAFVSRRKFGEVPSSMTDHDLTLDGEGGPVVISITALTDEAAEDADDVAAVLTEEYGSDLRER